MVAGGACMVAGGACMIVGDMCGCRWVYVVAGGHAWLPGACMVVGGVHRIQRDTVILLECILVFLTITKKLQRRFFTITKVRT